MPLPITLSEILWFDSVDAAISEGEVAIIVCEYLKQLPDVEFKNLPEHCRPGRVIDGEDISRWAYTLATSHCAQLGAEMERDRILVKVSAFFAHASMRVALLASPRSLERAVLTRRV